MTKQTRRQFLHDSIFTAAAISAAPMIGSASRAQAKSKNDKLLCAVIG